MIIKGDTHLDERGRIRFINEFSFKTIKRFYCITHTDTNVIRGWQGHEYETKFFFVVKGVFAINWIKIDNWQFPSKNLEVESKILSENNSEILILSNGYVNGFKALESNSSLIVYSDKTLEESKNDDFRYPIDYWNFIE